MYTEDEYLLLSGIQHFVFCRRQWALIHLEQQWEENFRTIDGKYLHSNAHDSQFREKRGNTIITRAMPVSSSTLGISGECDVVEFKRAEGGVEIFGLSGKYEVLPVEYKRGEPKKDESDIMQLTAQVMCLEDMLCCKIPYGYMFYGENRRRMKVVFDEALRDRTKKVIEEMHTLYRKGHTPKVKRTKACNACSLRNLCLPAMDKKRKASDYVKEMLGTEV